MIDILRKLEQQQTWLIPSKVSVFDKRCENCVYFWTYFRAYKAPSPFLLNKGPEPEAGKQATVVRDIMFSQVTGGSK